MNWITIAVIAPLFFVSYQALSKLLVKGTSIFLVNAYASLIGAVIMLVLFFFTSENKSIVLDSKNLPLALSIGALIAFGNFLIIKAYVMGAPQSSFTSIFYPVLIVYGVLVGLLFWGDKLGKYQIIGMALLLIGLILITYKK